MKILTCEVDLFLKQKKSFFFLLRNSDILTGNYRASTKNVCNICLLKHEYLIIKLYLNEFQTNEMYFKIYAFEVF